MADLDWRAGSFTPEMADVGNAFAQGMGLAHQQRKMNMAQQQFDAEMQDKQELRNAMAEYGAAQDDQSKRSAMAKIGVVSPEMMVRLEENYRKASADEREDMQLRMEQRGQAAYQALQMPPEKRQEFWEKYRSSLDPKIQQIVPADADETSLNVVMAQSVAALDQMNKMAYLNEQGRQYRERDERQYSQDVGLAKLRHGLDLSEEEVKQKNRMDLQGKRNEARSSGGESASLSSLNTSIEGMYKRLNSGDIEPGSADYNSLAATIRAYEDKRNSIIGVNPMSVQQAAPATVQKGRPSETNW